MAPREQLNTRALVGERRLVFETAAQLEGISLADYVRDMIDEDMRRPEKRAKFITAGLGEMYDAAYPDTANSKR